MGDRKGVAEYTLENGGGTFDAETGALRVFTGGYVVGMAHGTAALVAVEPRATLEARLAEAMTHVAGQYSADSIGTWLQDDVIHVDPVEWSHDWERANYLGHLRGQQAVWGVAEGTELPVRLPPGLGVIVDRLPIDPNVRRDW